jgi:hypothetical protein
LSFRESVIYSCTRATRSSAGIGQENIRKVFLTIPNILPSRLTTIQKACPEQSFNAHGVEIVLDGNKRYGAKHSEKAKKHSRTKK